MNTTVIASSLTVPRWEGGEGEKVATAIVGRSYTSRPMSLGLEAPLPVLGGSRAAIDGLRLADFSWQPDVPSLLESAIRSAETGRMNFGAVLLEGEAGAGRTHLARRLSHLAGLPHVLLDLGAPDGMQQLWQSRRGPDLVLPSAPVLAMAAARCANPVISVTGIEQLGADAQGHLARMIDPHEAVAWRDHAAGGTVDLSQVSWMIQSHVPGLLSPRLAALLRPVRLRWPSDDDLPLHAVEVAAEAAIDENASTLSGHLVERIIGETRCRNRERSTAALYQRTSAMIREALR
ncbi:hypothetical protein LQ953_03410 [Sphingomonas sp. IC-56]|uniref:hypothetical protein n=1 Tax=Sphingomonas sp. IC-56 TaxID=2898529 RepID=UPI001E51C974|nr:hypothetical protein [Sphingomonas sp. IC-56]MCD2323060.1 hypothetical protein [Sphingomonas sp. IC-56]